MNCWMFPGQPITFANDPVAAPEFQKIAQLCREVTGFNPRECDASSAELSESVRLQLFGVCVSLYRIQILLDQGIIPDLITEHSMGIYPALAASGAIDAVTALGLTRRLGECMAGIGKQREYALGCVIGLPCEALQRVAANNGVHIANHNTSRHFLLAGERENMTVLLGEATAAGAFSASMFPCDAPLHTPLMEGISDELKLIVADYRYYEPQIPVVEHISQTALTAAAIPAFLVDELSRPVYWESTYRVLRSRGVTKFHEVGAGSVLTKFNRWIDSEL